jgi:putative ABC transport system permease protein
MRIPINYSARSMWARRSTTLAAAGGIALVVFVLAASEMLTSGMRGTLLRSAGQARVLVMEHDSYTESGSRIPQSMLTQAASAPGIRRDARGEPLVGGESLVQIFVPRTDDPKHISAMQVRGVSENVFALRPEVRVVQGRTPLWGSDEAMIGAGIDGNYRGLGVGGQFPLKKGRNIQIVGVFEAQGSAYESEIWTGLDVVRTSLGWEGYLSSVTAVLESTPAFDAFGAALEADKSLGLAVATERAYYERLSEGLTRSVTVLGDVVALIFACGAVLGAAITMNEAIARRRKEIGVLRALGFSASEVMVAFLLESAAVALGGALVGIGFASLLSFADLSATDYGTGNDMAFAFEPRPVILMRALLVGAVVGVLGGVFPAVKAARTSPVVAMRV